MNTWKSLILGIVLGLLISGAILLIALPPRGQPLILSVPPTPSTITVYVTGAVNNPGVYTLPISSRVNDAVQSAGGFASSADQDAINLADFIEDGSEIIVPSIDESANSPSTSGMAQKTKTSSQVDYPININTATLSILQDLPGIGLTKATAIITYRQEHGPFGKIEDLLNVSGIGPSLFAQLKDLITTTDIP